VRKGKTAGRKPKEKDGPIQTMGPPDQALCVIIVVISDIVVVSGGRRLSVAAPACLL
jgi:hypothetical protein